MRFLAILLFSLYIFSLLIICLITSLVSAKCEKKSELNVKTYKIDLDLPPADRFTEVTTDFKSEILVLLESEKKKIGEYVWPIVEFIGSELESYFPYPFYEEIRSMAKVMDTNIGDVVLFQVLYDFTANKERKFSNKYCVGILSEQEDGQIIHGRNLDYDFPTVLQNLVYKAQFYRNGSLLFTSAQFAGHLGIVTGHKHNAFTFSINERDQGDWWTNFMYALLDKKATPLSFLTRDLMENVTNYKDAVNFMGKADLIAPAYFIIGGVNPNEATILTRNQTSLVDTWSLNSKSRNFDRWFLIETNYDHWTQPPSSDDRRTPGIKAMEKLTQANINYKTLFDVISMRPICNNLTAYSVVMSAKDNDATGFKIVIH